MTNNGIVPVYTKAEYKVYPKEVNESPSGNELNESLMIITH